MKRFNLLLFAIIFCQQFISAQFYSTGESPSSIKWKQFETANFQIVFDAQNENTAVQVAKFLEGAYLSIGKDLSHSPRKIPVVLKNHISNSNGLVVWAPRRMEINTIPPQDESLDSWLKEVCIHEFRHVVQMDKLNQGLTKVLAIVLGEQMTGATSALVPRWFFEGDAVYAETVYGIEGRGRIPEFSMGLRALALEDEFYTYDKFLMGSYKDKVPNHYQFGYHLVLHGREKYGDTFWEKNLNYTARKPYSLLPFYFSIKKQTGLSRKEFFEESFRRYYKQWAQEQNDSDSSQTYISKASDEYISYRYGIKTPKGNYYAYKTSASEIGAIVGIDSSGKEQNIYYPCQANINSLSFRNNKLYFNEWISDTRWGNRNYSVIKEVDLTTGESRFLSKNSRYFASKVSPDGTSLASIEIDVQNRFFLVIHDLKTNTIKESIPSPANSEIQYPNWNKNSDKIVCSFLQNHKKGFFELDVKTQEWKKIFTSESYNVRKPAYFGNEIIFEASIGKTDQIYLLKVEGGEVFQISDSKYGAYDPFLFEYQLIYSDYSRNGHRIAQRDCHIKSNQETIQLDVDTYPNLKELKKSNVRFNAIDSLELVPKPYSKLKNLFKIHSWIPFYANYDNIMDGTYETPSIGAQIFSQNLLSTSFLSASYERKKEMHYYHLNYSYKGFYPVFDFSFDYGGCPSVFVENTNIPSYFIGDRRSFTGKVYVPFILTRSHYYTGFTPSFSLKWTNDYQFVNNSWKRGMGYTESSINFYSYRKRAKKDIEPRFGLVLNLKNYHVISPQKYLGDIWLLSGTNWFPGLIKHHSIKFNWSFEKQNYKLRMFGGYTSNPRGYMATGIAKAKAMKLDYVFPLAHPDLSIANLAYIKRVRINLFYDRLRGDILKSSANGAFISKGSLQHSMGYELRFDWHAFRSMYPLTSGLRSSYKIGDRKYFNEFLFSINLNAL